MTAPVSLSTMVEREAAASDIPRWDAGGLRALISRRHTPVPMMGWSGGQELQMLYTRGSTLRSTMEYLTRVLDADEREEVLARLSAPQRQAIDEATVTDDVPYDIALRLWRSAELTLGVREPGWAEQAGAEAIRVRGVQLYSGLLKKPTPLEFVTQHISLFQRYYRPGDMKITEAAPGHARARLVGFEPQDRLFCRRLTGGWEAAVTIAGGTDAAVEHVRCTLEGDPFCEWEVQWT